MNVLDKIQKGLATLTDQDDALKHPETAYYFAYHVTGANIEKCQEVVCRDPYWSVIFARHIPGADIAKCQEAACKNPAWAYCFVCDVPEADIEKGIDACKGTEYEAELNKYLMNKALI